MASFCPKFSRPPQLMVGVTCIFLLQGCAGGSSPDAQRNTAQASGNPESAAQIDDGRRFSIQLGWSIPLARTNGDVLYANELVGYEIIYSRQLDSSPRQIRIEDPLQTEADLNNLPAGQYQFAIAAIDSHGLYSNFSTPVEITLD